MTAAPPALRTVLWRIVLLCLVIRVLLQVLGMASLVAHGQPLSRGLEMWSHWDAPHYLRLAEVGYVPADPVPPECTLPNRPVHPCDDPLFIVFFPFFPAAVAVVGLIVRNLIASGLIVSLAASIGASWFLYRLVERDRGHQTAWRSIVLLLSFPTAYFLAAPYSEALFLFATVAAIYAARTGKWLRSGFAGALATGTRVTGLALLPALVVEAMRRDDAERDRLRRFAAVGLATGGVLTYLLINQTVHGDPFHFLDVQRTHWYQHLVWPWQPIIDAVRGIAGDTQGADAAFIFWGRLAAFVFALPILVVAARRLKSADAVYAWVGFVLIMSASWLLSLPRYLLVLYPIFIVSAEILRSRRAFVTASTLSVALQGWLFWRYAVGAWTF